MIFRSSFASIGFVAIGLLLSLGMALRSGAEHLYGAPLSSSTNPNAGAWQPGASGTVPPVVITDVSTLSTFLHFPIIFLPSQPTTRFLPFVQVPSPYQPVQPHPPNLAQMQSPNVFLSWTILAANIPQVYYDVYLAANESQPNELLAQGLAHPYFDPPTLAADTQYYWRVVAVDATGVRVAGPVWTFRTEPEGNPPATGTMITIPAGEFWMGCDAANDRCRSDSTHREQPLHRVYLDAYEIDKYETTNREYRACVAARECRAPRKPSAPGRNSYFNNPQYDDYPVMYVSWSDAQTYCGWLGKRLPTEAEWEKAARGPIDTRIWPWGNEAVTCERANHRVHCGRMTTPVGAHPSGASPYGLMDMSGNVFEWVADKYDAAYYSRSPYANPQGPDISRPDLEKPPVAPPLFFYTIRGGSYHDNWWYSRVAHRHWGHHGDEPNGDAPYFRSFRVGFRCARSIDE